MRVPRNKSDGVWGMQAARLQDVGGRIIYELSAAYSWCTVAAPGERKETGSFVGRGRSVDDPLSGGETDVLGGGRPGAPCPALLCWATVYA